MKKIATALLLCTAAVTAQAQTVEDAKSMARCSAEFTMSATLLGENSPYFGRFIKEAQQSAAISRGFYQKIGMTTSQTDAEAKRWIGTLNRQYKNDPTYVKDYLIDQTKGCSSDNAKLQRFAI